MRRASISLLLSLFGAITSAQPPVLEDLPAAGPAVPTSLAPLPSQSVMPAPQWPSPSEIEASDQRIANAYLGFGYQTGIVLGIGGAMGLLLDDRNTAASVVGVVGPLVLSNILALSLQMLAKNDHWRAAPGQYLAGLYPGVVQGVLLGGSIVASTGLDGDSARRTIGITIGAMAVLSVVLHGHAAERAATRSGLYYVTTLLAAIAMAPFAVRFDEPRIMLYGATTAGVANMVLTGLAPTLQW